ncbi:DUF2314 domain-containing protein [Microcoleus sp. N9_B4]|uniref:DUF2314 domain-containing protein n=1 Tax=Microcoleus sp. N9_B4 TaxID=3055386 RepID=UPI002FD6D6E3
MNQNIYRFKGNDPDINLASKKARESFKYFWRELSWERRRIIPALDISAVKLQFSTGKVTDSAPSVEHIWVGNVNFDGRKVSGDLLNNPRWIDGIGAGDQIVMGFKEMSDWIYSIDGMVYGAYTVNAIRLKMNNDQRRVHDDAWGLEFGDPREIRIVPDSYLNKESRNKDEYEIGEHPMSENMAAKIDSALSENPTIVNQIDENGWTMLQYEALAGNLTPVKLLLKYGADKMIKNPDGFAAIDLAEVMKWNKITDFLR